MSSEIVAIRKETLTSRQPTIIGAISDLAVALMNSHRLGEAERPLSETLGTSLEVLGIENPLNHTILSNLGLTYRCQNRLDEAEQKLRKALQMRISFLGENHSDTIASMDNLATVQASPTISKFQEAEIWHRQAWELHSCKYGKEHPNSLICANNLASTLINCNRLEEAEVLLKDVIEMEKRVFGPDHPSTLNSMIFLKVDIQRHGCGVGAELEIYDPEEEESSKAKEI